LKIRFLAAISCSEIVKKFWNESIRINLINEAEEKVNFTIENRDTSKGEVQLRVSFSDPK
jgi:hypothetical protein